MYIVQHANCTLYIVQNSSSFYLQLIVLTALLQFTISSQLFHFLVDHGLVSGLHYSSHTLTDFKFQDLERRERQLRDEQKRLEEARVYGDRVPNFPPLPKFFPCTPCVYHNIDFDIAPEHQLNVKRVFYHWQCKCILVK